MSTYPNTARRSTTKNKPEAPTPEHADFAAAMTADAFGHHFPAEGSDDFRDRAPTFQRLDHLTGKIVQRAAALRVLQDDDEAA